MLMQPIQRSMTCGRYLQMRREAAGLSISDVAVLISTSPRRYAPNVAVLEMIEADRWQPSMRLLRRLRLAFAFDLQLVELIGADVRPFAPICRSCACSDLDACDDEFTGPCAWATPARDLCTHCARQAAGAQPDGE